MHLECAGWLDSATEWSGIHGMPAIVKYLPPIEHTVVREGLECRGCWPRWLLEPWIRGRQHSSATEPAAGDLLYMRWWASSALHCIALHCIALQCIAFHCSAFLCIAVHSIAVHCFALHCVALHCVALHFRRAWFFGMTQEVVCF